jgi:hypothetical protein
MPLLTSSARAGVAVAVLLSIPAATPFHAQQSRERDLRNAWEVHHEFAVAPEARSAVAEHFLSFFEYHDLVMFHPTVGYYASGRGGLVDD